MRRLYIHHLDDWPRFRWDSARLSGLLASVRHRQGLLAGHMKALGFDARQEAVLRTLTADVLKSSEIEGEKLDAMQVVSGPVGKERVHFEAVPAARIPKEMTAFLDWFNRKADMDEVLHAALAHLWFVTIHPFDDGNGRVARAVADMDLARSEKSD